MRDSEEITGMQANSCRETILVADDEPQVLELVVELLSQGGYVVLAASDGEEALRIAEAHPGRIDLLLTDVVMPGMRGTELARYLCDSRPGLRVAYMSGYIGNGADKNRVLECSAGFLRKPFSPRQLFSTLRTVLDAPPDAPPTSYRESPAREGAKEKLTRRKRKVKSQE